MERVTKASLAAAFVLVAASIGLWVNVRYGAADLDEASGLQVAAMVLGAPAVVFAYVYLTEPMRQRRQEQWQARPPAHRAAIGAVAVALVVGVNVAGLVISKQIAEDLHDAFNCEDGPLFETGQGNATATLPRSTALHPLLASDAQAQSTVANMSSFSALDVVPTWDGDAMDLRLSVRSNGEWFHGGSYPDVRSGQSLRFELTNPDHDAIQFSLTAGPAAEDRDVTLHWVAFDRERC